MPLNPDDILQWDGDQCRDYAADHDLMLTEYCEVCGRSTGPDAFDTHCDACHAPWVPAATGPVLDEMRQICRAHALHTEGEIDAR